MGKGYKCGSGRSDLNFRVVAYASKEAMAAAAPRNNTIGVVTTVKITGYMFSATEPENPSEGMVWFSVGTVSAGAFSITKKNTIMVYPMYAKQYISGAWVNVTAQTCQNGAWVEWTIYLYNAGDECKDLTGGWYSSGLSVTNGDDSVTLTLSASAWNESSQLWTRYSGGYFTVYAVDLTDINTLSIDVLQYSAGAFFSGGVTFGIASVSGDVSTSVGSVSIEGVGKYLLDVSAITGRKYVYVYIPASRAATTLTFDEIRTE